MLEHDGVLLTWQIPSPDLSALPLQVRRIANHRLAYLEYEGPLTGDRGSVTRVQAGWVTIRDLNDTLCAFDLSGGRFEGAFRLELAEALDGRWLLRSAGKVD